MEERYFVVKEDLNKRYGTGWFQIMAFPSTDTAAMSFAEKFAREDPNGKYMIAKVTYVAEVNVDVKFNKVQ